MRRRCPRCGALVYSTAGHTCNSRIPTDAELDLMEIDLDPDPLIYDENGLLVRASVLAARYRRETIERRAWRFASKR